jgi:hypothetical protein
MGVNIVDIRGDFTNLNRYRQRYHQTPTVPAAARGEPSHRSNLNNHSARVCYFLQRVTSKKNSHFWCPIDALALESGVCRCRSRDKPVI